MVGLEKIDPDFALYTEGEISRGELYKRWKKRHALGPVQAVVRDIASDITALGRDLSYLWSALLHRDRAA